MAPRSRMSMYGKRTTRNSSQVKTKQKQSTKRCEVEVAANSARSPQVNGEESSSAPDKDATVHNITLSFSTPPPDNSSKSEEKPMEDAPPSSPHNNDNNDNNKNNNNRNSDDDSNNKKNARNACDSDTPGKRQNRGVGDVEVGGGNGCQSYSSDSSTKPLIEIARKCETGCGKVKKSVRGRGAKRGRSKCAEESKIDTKQAKRTKTGPEIVGGCFAAVDAASEARTDALGDEQKAESPHVGLQDNVDVTGNDDQVDQGDLDVDQEDQVCERGGHVVEVCGQVPDDSDMDVLLEHRGYCRREQFLISLEQSGELKSRYVYNDGNPQHMIWLTGVKTAIINQLPNMPREYITRVVMDRRHRSVALIQKKSENQNFVMGGAVYRPFHKQKFGELVFFAIDGVQQVKGFGTHLMNCLKEFARDMDNLTHILTYADNKATGFFAKNGFSRRVTLPKDSYLGYIKDYEYAVPMECILLPEIPYMRIPDMVKRQRRHLLSKLKSYSRSHIKQPGLEVFRKGPGQRINVKDIPGVSEAKGLTTAPRSTSVKLIIDNKVVDATPSRLREFMDLVIREAKKRVECWPFREAVNAADVPDYYTIITDPVDISLIEERLSSGNYYITLDIFQSDWKRMFDNCRMYNAESTVYYKLAEKLDKFVSKFISTRIVRG